ncbi:hypothetical protein A2U01_0032050, partial [Trifolium medium]|nr:hypothetical protein [Trifolium medium]
MDFIWAGDINSRKIVTVVWHKVCTPIFEGGVALSTDPSLALNAK